MPTFLALRKHRRIFAALVRGSVSKPENISNLRALDYPALEIVARKAV
jgi:hypothetical protein